jgi:selenide,water dikinase
LPPSLPNANVLVGLDTPDDAGVYRLRDDLAIVQTVDFFTPIVDDPYAFGQIAAANALSDVYAMGGRPVTALNIVAFPVGKIPPLVLADILRGGIDKANEAGVVVLGGHSIDDVEPKYGMAVTGLIHPDRILSKAGARPGDRLVLTKPLGTGVLSSAMKRGLASPEEEAEAVRVMATLNDLSALLEGLDVRGLTDVTGFGLLGHASEMARHAGVGIRIHATGVPVLPSAWGFGREGLWSGGTRKNRAWLEDKVEFAPEVDETTRLMLCDAVTSGGLLIAVSEKDVGVLVDGLRDRHALAAAVIGECTDEKPGLIQVAA